MIFKKIAVCGSPLAGKTTLLSSIARINGSDRIGTMFGKRENTTRLDVSLVDCTLVCMTISGVFFHNQNDIVTRLLAQSQAIVYVCSAVLPEKAEPFYFDLYSKEAIRYHLSWNEIPWIFVLNKIDLGDANPLQPFIPPQFHDQIIRCVATEDIGVAPLWQRIVSAVS